ncbi:MAG: polysaccharide biosynthesis C-terminal domain-containing protein, partial [Lachnospiraceae bacterium]|nr:polysaccharide biosynthesis C-terminal domain-containing protein [Lachnospiraceae bacterium]
MKNRTLNMTEGSPVKLLISFSIPMLIGNIFQQLYNIADSMVVGRLVGAEALGAIGATGSITFMFFALCNGIGSGGGIITSQYFGRDDMGKVKSCIANTAYIMIAFPAVVGVIAFLLAPFLLNLLNTPEAIISESLSYLRLMCVGLVFVSLYNYVSSMLRALGDSKTPLYFLIFSCILNVGLDLLFVGTFKMGVTGAAVATLISQFVSGFFCILYAIRRNPYFKLSREDMVFNTG